MWRLRNSVDSCDYDTRAFYSKIPLQRYWQRRRYRIITSYIGDARLVLDAGCGSTQIMNGCPQVIGIDPQRRKLRFMRAPGRRLLNASTFALPFKDAAFDVVVSSQVIEHLPEDPVIFDELIRCLKPGGTLVLGTVDYGGWQWPLIERAYGLAKPTGYADEHITHYTRASLFELLRRRGLTHSRTQLHSRRGDHHQGAKSVRRAIDEAMGRLRAMPLEMAVRGVCWSLMIAGGLSAVMIAGIPRLTYTNTQRYYSPDLEFCRFLVDPGRGQRWRVARSGSSRRANSVEGWLQPTGPDRVCAVDCSGHHAAAGSGIPARLACRSRRHPGMDLSIPQQALARRALRDRRSAR